MDNAVERVRIANGMIQETAQVADVQMKSIDQIRDGIRDMSQVVSVNSAMARRLQQQVRSLEHSQLLKMTCTEIRLE